MTYETFGTSLELDDKNNRSISLRELQNKTIDDLVNVFFDHAEDISGRGNVHVLIIAPPVEVFAQSDQRLNSDDDALDDGSAEQRIQYAPGFHDMFKAKALSLSAPCQLIRPDTYDGGSTRQHRRFAPTLQDSATRAWNFHTAIYYKAGGIPWRLIRSSADYPACYVGIGFYMTVDRSQLLTGVAQIFNEHGEGIIVKGGVAQISKEDRSPHLATKDIEKLLVDTLASYRREHKNLPARLVVHKTSAFNEEEIEGCKAAVEKQNVELLDLVSVRRANSQLFRNGEYPPLRGTCFYFDDRSGLIYLRGSVPYFQVYPGMYIPRSFEFTKAYGESTLQELAKEILALSKINFNHTQFDGGEPITVRTARRVGDILKHVPSAGYKNNHFRYFI